jgi:hypothetical protein
VTLLTGSVLSGGGTLQLDGNNRLVVNGDASLPEGTWDFQGSSRIVSSGLLTVGPNALLRIDHSTTLPGPLDVAGTLTLVNSSTLFQIDGTLTLESTGTLNNPASIRVKAFANKSGVIHGNAPTISGTPNLPGIRASPITVLTDLVQDSGGVRWKVSRSFTLSWSAAPDGQFIVQESEDCIHWRSASIPLYQTAPGEYRAPVEMNQAAQRFFRVQQITTP